MFTISHTNTEKTPYIRHKSYENLFVLPYINCRLVFAEMAARAIGRGEFDRVVVDLPFFMNDNAWLEIPIESFPLVSSLIVNMGGDVFRTFNFVPNDAACSSVYMVHRLRDTGKSTELECIDDSNVISYAKESFNQPEIVLMDDFFAVTDGLETYFSPVYEHLDRSWATMSDDIKFFWDYRANIVAKRLDNSLKSGRKTLFVCNFRLWWQVHKKLFRGDFENKNFLFMQWTDQKAALVFQNPYLLWTRGVLDDFPTVVLSFFLDKMMEGADGTFDKLEVLNETIQESIDAMAIHSEKGLSIRRLKVFRQYLLRRLAINRRMTPTLTSYLDQAACSCTGKAFARALSQELLQYPVVDDLDIRFLAIRHDNVIFADCAFEIPDEFLQFFLNSGLSGSKANIFGDRLDSEKERERLVSSIRPFLTRREAQSLKGSGNTSWALKKEYIFHAQASRMVREAVERESREVRVVRSWGSLSSGIDWKQTIWSKALGENEIYIKKAKKAVPISFDLDFFTPTVFIFDETEDNASLDAIYDSNLTRRRLDLEGENSGLPDLPEPDLVYSIFYARTASEYLCEHHIKKETVSAILFLCTHSWMGLERYDNITNRPPKFQCRQSPDEDEELRAFGCPERLVACGMKYAEKVVIAVSRPSWRPSAHLLSFGKMRNVGIVHVPLSAISQEVIDRMKTIHLISTPLKKYGESDSILDRFVPGVFHS